MSATEILRPFGAHLQSNPYDIDGADIRPTSESFGKHRGCYKTFALDVEVEACANINRRRFTCGSSKVYRPNLTPVDLKGKRQAQPHAIARHIVTYILYNHPYTDGVFSYPIIAKHFNRDHTTIMSGARRMESFIKHGHEAAFWLEDVCEILASRYGAFSPWEFEGVTRPEKPQTFTITDEQLAATRERCAEIKRRNRFIHKMHKQGASVASIARGFELSPSQVNKILSQATNPADFNPRGEG